MRFIIIIILLGVMYSVKELHMYTYTLIIIQSGFIVSTEGAIQVTGGEGWLT